MSKADDLAKKFSGRLNTQTVVGNVPATSAPAKDNLADRDFRQLSPAEIIPDPTQPRKEFDRAELERLGQRLKIRQYQPIRVRWSEPDKKWMLIYGERRWRAAVLVGLPTLLCEKTSRPLTGLEILEEQIVENCHRADLNQMEKAESWQRYMIEAGISATELADRLNLDKSTVSQTLRLLTIPEERREQVRQEILPAREAIKAARIADATERERAFTEAVAGKIEPKRRMPTTGARETFTAANGIRISIIGPEGDGYANWLAALAELSEKISAKNTPNSLAS